MKVTGVKVTPFAASSAARGSAAKSGCIVEVTTDAGVSGIGVADSTRTTWIESLVQQLLVGADPRSVTGLWERMLSQSQPCHEIAALDVALWDLKAKSNAEPIWKTLGGSRPRANACASLPDATLSVAQLSDWFEHMARDHGVRAGKLRVGVDPRADLHRLEQVRTALLQSTAEPTLAIEASGSWSAQEATRRIREIEETFDIAWVEGATSSTDYAGLKHVSSAISGAVSVGKGLGALEQFLPYFQHRSADVIELDINALGITAALQLSEAAFGYELPVTLTAAPGNLHVHLAGVMPSFMSAEILEPAPASQVCTSEVRIENGWAVAGDAPGHGLTVNHAAPTAAPLRTRNRK